MIIAPHAILRYLERVRGLDTERERVRLRPKSLRGHLCDHGLVVLLEGAYPGMVEEARAELTAICSDAASAGSMHLRRDGFVFGFRNGALVTVLTQQMRDNSRQVAEQRARW